MPSCFSELIHSARRELVITTPYFVPDEQLLFALTSAARRGGSGRGGRGRGREGRAAADTRVQPPPARGVPVTSIRRTIAERMVHSLRTTAPVTLTTTVHAGNPASAARHPSLAY